MGALTNKMKLLTSVLLASGFAQNAGQETVCNDQHETWLDSTSESCQVYADKEYCTVDSALGSGWGASWGTFEEWADGDGLSGWTCPQCGCKVAPVVTTKAATTGAATTTPATTAETTAETTAPTVRATTRTVTNTTMGQVTTAESTTVEFDYPCTNVRLAHIDEECNGEMHYLAQYGHAVRDKDQWQGDLNTWSIALFNGGRAKGSGYGGGIESDGLFSNQKVNCANRAFSEYLVCEEPLPWQPRPESTTDAATGTTVPTTGHDCGHVRLVHRDEQCDGSKKSKLATYDDVIRHSASWQQDLNQWTIALFKNGRAYGHGYGKTIEESDVQGHDEVPCNDTALSSFAHFLVCDHMPPATTMETPTTTASTPDVEEAGLYECSNVRLSDVEEQCAVGATKNYLATYPAVTRDRDQWRSEMSEWTIAPFQRGRTNGDGYGSQIISNLNLRHENDFFNRDEFEVPCDSSLPFHHFLVCEEELPKRSSCSNVHITDTDEQCDGRPQNLLANFDAVMRDFDMWNNNLVHWGMAPFRDGQAVGSGYGNKVTRRRNFGMATVPCDGFSPFKHYLVCDEVHEEMDEKDEDEETHSQVLDLIKQYFDNHAERPHSPKLTPANYNIDINIEAENLLTFSDFQHFGLDRDSLGELIEKFLDHDE